jgi:hypothetical protein
MVLAGEFIELGQADGGGGGGAAGDADQHAFFAGQKAGHLHGFGGVHLLHPVDQRQVEGVRDEAGADALDLVRAGFQFLTGELLRNDRAFLRFDGDGQEVATLGVLDEPRNAGDGAAGADAGNQHVDVAIGVLPDLGSGGGFVNRRVRGILELLGQEVFFRIGRS